MSDSAPLAYRLLTGPDDRSFCERVSEALAQGYRLHGGPAITSVDGRPVVAQAVVLRGGPGDDGDGSAALAAALGGPDDDGASVPG
ncbi:DUF1737 domain-containing protein [Kineococcus glutinatus]|uniref:DUF1737 domain-containing protein n=1 Tax=Kineococcus glutinatus TaxID=1070872 RepID=A0ABP9HI94_9ACTN